MRHGFAVPYRTVLQRQLPVVCLAAALNKPAGFIQANPLGNGLVVIAGSGWSILLPLVWYDASRTLLDTLVMTRSGGGQVGGGSFGAVCPPPVFLRGISDELSLLHRTYLYTRVSTA